MSLQKCLEIIYKTQELLQDLRIPLYLSITKYYKITHPCLQIIAVNKHKSLKKRLPIENHSHPY